MFYTYVPATSWADYVGYARKKIFRRLPAFFLFGFFIGLGKELFRHFMHVDNLPANFLHGLVDLFIQPTNSYASSLWFIYVLAIYYMLIPLILVVIRDRLETLLLLGLLVHFLPVTNYFALQRAAEYLFVFSLGMYAIAHRDFYLPWIDRFPTVWMILFFSSFLLTPVPNSVSKLMIGLCSLPALHSLVRLPVLAQETLLKTLGEFTFPIYLMNTICIGLAKGITLKFIPWEREYFFVFFVLLFASGLGLPIVVKKYFFKKIPWLDRMTM